ncbi:MAG: hypothetical protein AAFV96_10855 [Pseudomonadota bacterium]
MDGFGLKLVADGLLIATALAAAIYCAVLSRRLRRLASTEDGIGGQITALNTAVEETRVALTTAQERIDALRNQSGQSSERVRREMAQARKLSEELAEAATEARALLDKLYTVEAPARAGGAEEAAARVSGPEAEGRAPDEEDEPFAVVGGDDTPDAQPAAPGIDAGGATEPGETALDAAFEEADAAKYSFGAAPEDDERAAAADPTRSTAGEAAGEADDAPQAAPSEKMLVPAAAAAGGRALRLERMAF